MYMVFLALLFLFAYAENCSLRTSVYRVHGASNANWWYFVPNTYGGRLASPCINISDSNNDGYRAAVKAKYPMCVGRWCQYEDPSLSGSGPVWSCLPRGSLECYQAEHIIPKVNSIPELAGCSPNIYGNLVMAYGRWNNALGNKYFSEKDEIYGQLFTGAYREVYKCCKGHYPSTVPVPECGTSMPTLVSDTPSDEQVPTTDSGVKSFALAFLIAVAIVCIILIIITLYVAYPCRKK